VPPDGVVSIVEALIPLYNGKYEKVNLNAMSEDLKYLSIRRRLRLSEEEYLDKPIQKQFRLAI
jgi:DNA (cytosine-5)-methyltransferase 1